MPTLTRFRFLFLAFPLVTAALVPAGGCNGEGEGMPCDTRAGSGGNNDCASGLVCTVLPNVQGARCCPTDRATATTPECSQNATSDAASPIPPDASGDGASQGGEAGEAATGEAATESGAGDAAASEAGDGAASGADGAAE